MKICDVILKIKSYYKGEDSSGIKINEKTTRDKILYGDDDKECTGIVTTVFASVDVIKKAHELGANLIIVHEALFWNHGDHQEWLNVTQNKTYLAKKKLLDDYQITVWRNHDYVHTGIPLSDDTYTDGIFYGFAKEMGWENVAIGDKDSLMTFQIPEMSAKDLAYNLINKFHLEGARIIGDPQTIVRKVQIPYHIFGDANEQIAEIDKENIDALLALELVDFSVNEYIRDSSMLGFNKVIITVGHFNMEEPGMKYMATYIPKALGKDIQCHFVQSGDPYHYIK